MRRIVFFSICLCLSTIAIEGFTAPKTCTYDTYKWNVPAKKSVEYHAVTKPYSELAHTEIDPKTGCSICREDQTRIALDNGKPVFVCTRLAHDIEMSLNRALDQGAIINSIIGYRVGQTRGDIDVDGNRTQFSNHSFGIAVDINAENNGLYGNCFQFSAQCRLRKGGAWRPYAKGGLHAHSPIVLGLRQIGLQWGGEIQGRQKDFMHFSPSGY
ncbi:MAG: hypothetical protein COA43_13610 [Robiginitomaculum sp.]|nr:MAG: hypothetical protein COA43_13610 [Robiginitomaculum sp.]